MANPMQVRSPKWQTTSQFKGSFPGQPSLCWPKKSDQEDSNGQGLLGQASGRLQEAQNPMWQVSQVNEGPTCLATDKACPLEMGR